MIPTSHLFGQSVMSALLTHDPVVQHYHAFFSLFDWSLVDRWQERRSPRGRPAHPESAYIKAFLVRISEGLIYSTQPRAYLVKHPLLVIELGFHLKLDPTAPYGFDVEKTLPCRYWFCQKLRALDQTLLQQLLHATVTALQAEIPGLGETVAFDVKHLYAWVKENNERVYVPERYDKEKRLAGDPDCRLGVKKNSNQEKTKAASGAEAPAPSPQKKKKKSACTDAALKQTLEPEKGKKELIWGYGSGVAATTHPTYGDVVLAEYTQPFNENDITYFRPLYQQVVVALNCFPTNITADAAFDAWYVYEAAARHRGIGAIPLRQSSKNPVVREADGTPHCPKGLLMHPTKQFNHTYGYRAQRFQCPLLIPSKTGGCCAVITSNSPKARAASKTLIGNLAGECA